MRRGIVEEAGIIMNVDNEIKVLVADKFMEGGDYIEERTTKTLQVHAYDWSVRDVYGDDDHVAIHCWALDRESKPHLLRFTDFPAFCHVELPIFVRNHAYNWRQGAVDRFMELLSRRLGEDAPIRYIYKQAKKTYYYRGNRRFPMVQLCFRNLRAMRHCSRLLENPLKTDDWGFIKCNVWEDDISVVRKLLTVRDVRYSQWFRAVGHKVEAELRVSTLEEEYIAEWDTMTPIPVEECKEWSTQPGILAFDIECYSDNHRAMPDRYNSKHVAYMISCIYQKYKNPGTRRRYGVVIGDCNHIPEEKLSNCEVIKVGSEYEMVEVFARIVNDTDPDILTGYNILGFDYPYLDHRVKRWLKQWPCMGRIAGEASYMTTKTWNSGAYGHQSINILQMEGRISIDLLPVVKRDYKLDKYDLNTVCRKFIGKTKHDVKASGMFLIYEGMRDSLTELVGILREEQENPGLSKNSDFIRRRDEAQEVFDRAKAETARVMEYCIQDSELVIELMEKMNIWVGLVEMSNIVGVTIVQLFTQGQQIRCLSQIYDLAARTGYILDKRDTPGFKFVGGLVYEPIPGLYENIICLDFSSLYPSIMMAYNICYTTLVPPELEDLIPDDDCNVIEFDQEEVEGADDENDEDEEVLREVTKKNKKGKKVSKHYRFKFYKNQEGLLPSLVRNLVAERRAVKRQIEQSKDELKALAKMKDIHSALEGYLDGTVTVMDSKIAEQRVKELSESKPPAPPDVISDAKRDLTVAKLFNTSAATKQLSKILKAVPPVHPDLVDVARYEVTVSQLQEAGNQDGLLECLENLNRSKASRAARVEALKLLLVVLDKRQLAIKVSANSFFGFLGVHTGGKMPLIEGAMSITAKGRSLISEVREYIEERYGGVQIYGDTDSVMMDLHIKDSSQCNYWGLRLAEEITGIEPGASDIDGTLWPEGRPGLFPPPLAMEFEKAMRLLCLKKKKYAAYLLGKDGNFKTEDITDRNGNAVGKRLSMLKKGIILARRDNCAFLRNTYTKILDLIMNKSGLDEAMSVLIDAIQDLLDGKIPYEDLVIVRGLGANYKSDRYFMKVFADELKKAGKIVNPGDRLDFVIVEDPTATLLGHKMRLSEQYLDRLDSPNPEHIDYNYYIEKALMNPINQLFEVGFKDTISCMRNVAYRPSNRHKTIYLDRPVQIILKMRERGYDLSKLKEAVNYNFMKSKGITPLLLNVVDPNAATPPPKPMILNILPVQPSTVQTSHVQTSTAQPSTAQPSTVQHFMAQTSTARPSHVQTSTVQSFMSQISMVQPFMAQTSASKHPPTPTLVMPRIAAKQSPCSTSTFNTLHLSLLTNHPPSLTLNIVSHPTHVHST